MADIDRVKFNRKPKRGQSTKLVNQMNAALAAPDPDLEELEANLAFLVELHEQLDGMDQKITDAMYDAGTSEADQAKEFEDCESYKLKFLRLKKKVEKLTQEKALHEVEYRQRIILARGGFGAEDKKKPSGTEKAKRVTETPTLAGFVSVGNGESEKLEMGNIVKTRSGRKVKIPIRFTPEVRLKK
ncbi:unnamed protein product [Orchesella dallaii]|uniref:Uncharacterized protein n=1 Tax=Orchesella dallaii TaxID=48710 RepID=A0ABP1R6B9_9HEXA